MKINSCFRTRESHCTADWLAYRARVKNSGTIGNEEKSPIHIADVIEMMGSKSSRDESDDDIWSKKSKTADGGLITRGPLVTTSRRRGNMDPVVSETIAGNLRSGWRGENSNMLVPQVVHHATSDGQHTDKHWKFSEVTGASHESEGYIHHIGQVNRNHQRDKRREPSVDTNTMRTGIALPKALRKRELVGGHHVDPMNQGWRPLAGSTLKWRFVGGSGPHFTKPTKVVAPWSEGRVFVIGYNHCG